VAWSLLVVWAAVIWYGSSFSLGTRSIFTLFGVDKLAHMAEYALLGLLAARAVIRSWPSASAWEAGQGGVALAGLWGWLDEIHQFYVPGRSTDPFDLAADILGAVAGAWIALRLLRSPKAGRPTDGGR
jgi:VanZ family protein